MLKTIALTICASSVVVLSAAIPRGLPPGAERALEEPSAMLVMATLLFGVAAVMRRQGGTAPPASAEAPISTGEVFSLPMPSSPRQVLRARVSRRPRRRRSAGVRRVMRRWRQTAATVREMVGEQLEYRELLATIARRDLMLRYKQTVMGVGWAVCMPLVNTIVFSVIFTRVAPVQTPVAYPLYAFCGLLAWNFSASALRFASLSLTGNPNLVTKVYFPREIFPFSAVLVALADLAVASVLLVAMMAYYQVGLSWSLLLLPAVVLTHVIFTAAVALLLSMGNLFYRDVKYLFEIVLSVWMFATSVVYPVERIDGVVGALLALNPMTPIIDAYRQVLLYGQPPGPAFLGSTVFAVVVLVVAWWKFHQAESEFAESL
jgi:lipopolysaccharide transport system permease protein